MQTSRAARWCAFCLTTGFACYLHVRELWVWHNSAVSSAWIITSFVCKCAAGVPDVLLLFIRAERIDSHSHLKTKPFLLKLNIYIDFNANIYTCYFVDEYVNNMVLYEDTKNNCKVTRSFLARKWLCWIWIHLVWIWPFLHFDLRKQHLCSATSSSFTTVLHSSEMQLRDKNEGEQCPSVWSRSAVCRFWKRSAYYSLWLYKA